MFVFNPEFGVSLQHCEDLFDCMKMGWCAFTGLAPLLENTKLNGTCYGRRMHLRHHTVTPFFAWLPLMIDDLHLVASLRSWSGPSRLGSLLLRHRPAPSLPFRRLIRSLGLRTSSPRKTPFDRRLPRGPTTPVAG